MSMGALQAAQAKYLHKHAGDQLLRQRRPVDLVEKSDEPLIRTAEKVNDQSSWICKKCTKGGVTSYIARAVVAFGGFLGALFLISNPIGWGMIAWRVNKVCNHAEQATSILHASKHDGTVGFLQMAEFEISAWLRNHGFKGDNYNVVYTDPDTGRNLFLGALPDHKRGDLTRLPREGVGAILSINEPWERTPFGNSDPITQQEWQDAGVNYFPINVFDHSYLNGGQLEHAKGFIEQQFALGRDVYVHCRAGVGRSAMAVAYFMMREGSMTPQEAADQILEGRSQSTIENKLEDKVKDGRVQYGLNHYADDESGLVFGDASAQM